MFELAGTTIASPLGAGGSYPIYFIFAFAACANIGGVSPVVPKSTPPTFKPSNS